MAEVPPIEKYKKLAALVEELSKKYGAVERPSEELIKKLREIEERVDFKLKEIEEKIATLKGVPFSKKIREEILADIRQHVEDRIKEIKELPELKKVTILEGILEKFSEKIDDLDGRVVALQKEASKPIEERIPELGEMKDFLSASDRIISSKAKEEVEKRLEKVFLGLAETRKEVRGLMNSNQRLEKALREMEKAVKQFDRKLKEVIREHIKEVFIEKLRKEVKKELPKIAEEHIAEVGERLKLLLKENASSIIKKLEKIGVDVKKLEEFRKSVEGSLATVERDVEQKLRTELLTLLEKSVDEAIESRSKEFREVMEKIKKKAEVTAGEAKNLIKSGRKILAIAAARSSRVTSKKFEKLEAALLKKIDEKIIELEKREDAFLGRLKEVNESIENRIGDVNLVFSKFKEEIEEKVKEERLAEIMEKVIGMSMRKLEERISSAEKNVRKLSKKISTLEKLSIELSKLAEEVEK